jgi:hypothetical protein
VYDFQGHQLAVGDRVIFYSGDPTGLHEGVVLRTWTQEAGRKAYDYNARRYIIGPVEWAEIAYPQHLARKPMTTRNSKIVARLSL